MVNKTKNELRTATCRAFRHRFDGNVFEEKRGRRTVWVAYLECLEGCGRIRKDTMQPFTCQLLSRSYKQTDGVEYDTQMSIQEAKIIVFREMFSNTEAE